MLATLMRLVYWLSAVFAISLTVAAAALAFNLDRTDGYELYVLCTVMIAAAIGIGLAGRAIYQLAR